MALPMTQPCPDQQANAVLPYQQDHESTWMRRKDRLYQHDLRTCSYCGGLHPDDAIAAVEKGCVVEGTTKAYKRYILVPNKHAGKIVVDGGQSGPVFARPGPKTRVQRLLGPHAMPERLGNPTLMERLVGRYNRDTYGPAPAFVHQKLYMWHFDEVSFERYRSALLKQRS